MLIFARQKSCPKNKLVILADKDVVVPRMNTTVSNFSMLQYNMKTLQKFEIHLLFVRGVQNQYFIQKWQFIQWLDSAS